MSEGSSGSAPAGSAAPVSNAAPVDSTPSSQESQGQSGSGQPSTEDIQAAVENGDISEAQAQKMIKKFQLKIKGQTVEREVDLSDENYLRDQFQLAEMSKLSMQTAAEIRKSYEREMARLKDDPFSVLQEMGLDPEELSAGFIHKRIEEMKKSPEQVAQEKLQRDLEEARAEAKKLKEEKEEAEMSKLHEKAVVTLNEEIDKAISGHKKLPNSPMVRKKIADSMLWAMNNGFGDVTAEDVVPLVEKELKQELGGLFEGLEDEAFEDWVGKERLEKARKKRIAAAKPATIPNLTGVKPTTGGIKPKTEEAPAQKISARDFFRSKK